MKSILVIGVLLLVLGVLALVVPIPRRENHSVKIGDTKIGLQTENSEKLSPAVFIGLPLSGTQDQNNNATGQENDAWYTSRPDPVSEFLVTKISTLAVDESGRGKETSCPGAI